MMVICRLIVFSLWLHSIPAVRQRCIIWLETELFVLLAEFKNFTLDLTAAMFDRDSSASNASALVKLAPLFNFDPSG